MVTNESLEAYNNIKPELGDRQLLVYNALKKLEYCTNTMISKELNLPINCVTPRVHELRKKNLVIRSHISTCPITRNHAQYWKIANI